MEWGHLAAGDAALNAALHQDGQQYEMIGDEVEGLVAAPAEGGAAASMGRGRDAVKPAWMTDPSTAAAPGSGETSVIPPVTPASRCWFNLSSCSLQGTRVHTQAHTSCSFCTLWC